ncbi:hypothetical protein C823_004401 [Eubacterium plexicaudatum ASF492]|nr:hypothetical protein C823_004401 [Eubacterium plexicaudatum ASF492]
MYNKSDVQGHSLSYSFVCKLIIHEKVPCALFYFLKSCKVVFYLFVEMVVFLAVFVITGLLATSHTGVTEALPITDLLKWCTGLFFTMLPGVATMWAITVLFEKPWLSVGFNLLFVIPGVLVANTPFWIIYPYCYSGYLVSCSLHDYTTEGVNTAFRPFPFLLFAMLLFALAIMVAMTRFGKRQQ